jgi:hypothetical protein
MPTTHFDQLISTETKMSLPVGGSCVDILPSFSWSIGRSPLSGCQRRTVSGGVTHPIRSLRNLRFQPKTAFLRFPLVHGANLEGQLRVEGGRTLCHLRSSRKGGKRIYRGRLGNGRSPRHSRRSFAARIRLRCARISNRAFPEYVGARAVFFQLKPALRNPLSLLTLVGTTAERNELG